MMIEVLLVVAFRRIERLQWRDLGHDLAGESLGLIHLRQKFPIGPSKPGEFTAAVNDFVTTTLKGKLTGSEWEALRRLEGKWPDYPKELVRLARMHDLEIPGVTPPGPPSRWEQVYNPPRSGPKPGS